MRLGRRAIVSAIASLPVIGSGRGEGASDSSDPDAEALGWGEGGWGEGAWGGQVADDPGEIDECFIATAACGTKEHEKVVELRAFRDSVLRRSRPGRAFIRAYYATSPPVARWIARSERRKRAVRWLVVRPAAAITRYTHE